jgi:hypothetical protein
MPRVKKTKTKKKKKGENYSDPHNFHFKKGWGHLGH